MKLAVATIRWRMPRGWWRRRGVHGGGRHLVRDARDLWDMPIIFMVPRCCSAPSGCIAAAGTRVRRLLALESVPLALAAQSVQCADDARADHHRTRGRSRIPEVVHRNGGDARRHGEKEVERGRPPSLIVLGEDRALDPTHITARSRRAEEVSAAFLRLARRAKQGDVILVFLNGHGGGEGAQFPREPPWP